MNRNITYTNEQLSAKDTCNTNIDAMVGLAQLAEGVLGEGPWLNNLSCTQATVPNLTVYLNPGEIYSMQNIDDSDFGPIPSDTTHQILKTGAMIDRAIITLTAPVTPGDAIIYLIQVEFSEVDDQTETRPYYGASPMPTLTRRADLLVYNVKPSSSAPSPTPPTPDVGFVGAWLVEVDYGQTAIINSDITAYPNAPFITEKLNDKISLTTAESLFPLKTQIQSGALVYASTTGTNTYAASLSPALAGYTDGMEVNIKFVNANTTASTLNLNALGAISILRSDGSALVSGEIAANSYRKLIYRSSSAAFLLQLADDDFVRGSTSSTGYEYLPGGLIMQWGKATLPASGTSVSFVNVTLPISYTSSTSYYVTTSYCQPPNGGTWGACTTSNRNKAAANFDFYGDTADPGTNPNAVFANTVEVNWMAIGS